MNPMPFAALHPTPSRLTSTASSAAAASQRTATTVAGSSFLSSDDGDEAEDDDDYVNIATEDAQGDEMNMAADADGACDATHSARPRGMLFIAHRGNINGPNPPLENQPRYLLSALSQGFDVEVDAWYHPPTNQWALGHDGPDYPIEYDFLLQPRVWVHAKNTAALREMRKDARVHCFAHDQDEYTLTSKGYIWAYPDVALAGTKCIAVMYTDPFEVLGREEVGGVCHDIVGPLRERYLQMMAGREGEGVDAEEDRKPAATPNFRGEGEVDGDDLGADIGRCDDDRKPAAKPLGDNDERKPAANRTKSDRSVATAGDQRFVCAICLDIVSDEPVVTRCGHLYCWPCLYQWLQPGMLLGEYRTAFGGNGASMPSNNSVGGGLNFLSGGNHAYLPPQNDRPYNPAGRAFNERRRCCPICKAGCTVDSVVPIYIHVHSEHSSTGESELSPTNDMVGGESGSVRGDDDGNEGRPLSNDSLASLDVDHDSAEGSTGRLPFAAAASAPLDASAAYTTTSDNALDSMDDPTSANLGLRNRRRNAHDPNAQQSKRQRQQSADGHDPTTSDPSLCESPTRNAHGGYNFSAHDTPVHRNSRGVPDRANAAAADGSTADVPSRPIPAGNTPLGGQRNPHDVRRDASQPELNHERTASSGMASSSPFRIALRPRHPPRALTTPPHPGQAGLRGNDPHRPDFDAPFSRAHASHHRHGRLTSALLGIVDAVDRAAVGSGGGNVQPPPAPAVPTLHRSDGGMGGIGRASEQGAGAGADEYGSGVGYEEESSLAMAREFLSRLLLMLACFVILCLLLF